MDGLVKFYSGLLFHLLDSGVESNESVIGCSEVEIQTAERELGIKFPEAYRLFMQNFGERANFQDFQEYQLRFLPDAQEVMQDVASRNRLDFQLLFPFSQWQGYSVLCVGKQGNNPGVMLFVEGDEGVEIYKYKSFIDWLLDQIKNHLNYLALKKGSIFKTQLLEIFLTESRLAADSQ